MADVFVSYKAEDRRRVKPLVEALQADGFSVWWDEQIGGGDSWRETIERQLDEAKCVLVIWSKRSVGPEGRFVRDEADRAQRRGAYLPVRIDKVEPPLGFGETQALPLIGWHGDRSDGRYVELRSAVRATIAGKPRNGVRTFHADRGLSRRGVIAAGTIAAVSAAGIGVWLIVRPGSSLAADRIAVLPFANLSGDPSQAYFSDGIAGELRSALAQIPRLEVIGRTSSEALRNDPVNAARKLGAGSLITGSVRRSSSVLRISAQLVDATEGIERWSRNYDRSPGDVLQIQTDIATSVARSLSIILAPSAAGSLIIGGTSDPQAHDLYLRARELILSDDSEAAARDGLELLDRAIAIDPRYASAYAWRGALLRFLAAYYPKSAASAAEGFSQAAAECGRAIALAPRLSQAWSVLAQISRAQLNFRAALQQIRRATELGSDPGTILNYASLLYFFGRRVAALQTADRAVSLDPMNPYVYTIKALILLGAHRFQESVATARKGLAIAPKVTSLHSTVGWGLVLLGDFRGALAEFEQVQPADDPDRLVGESVAFAKIGNRVASDKALQKLTAAGDTVSYEIAEVHAQRGERDAAFAALDTALKVRSFGLEYLLSDPFLDPLRSDPRFAALLRKMNFPG